MSENFKVGIDYGGTKIEGILMDNEGNEILRKRSTYEKNYKSGIQTVSSLVEEFDKHTGTINTVGVGIPGSSSKETGLIKNANSIWLNDKPFKQDLENSLGRDIRLMNDANCFALSEAFDGAAKNYKTVFGIILGSGCGGGLIINKKILVGPNAFTGEWGHIPLGKPDSKNNIEEYISGKGLSLIHI